MNKKKGMVFWVTGYSGAGKTTISKHLLKNLKKNYGPIYFVNGDDIRKIFKLNKYDLISRKQYVQIYSEFGEISISKIMSSWASFMTYSCFP